MTPVPERELGNRAALMRNAAWKAAFRAALLSIPTSLIVAAIFWLSNLDPRAKQECVFHVLLWTNVCWISIAAAAQANKAREATMTPEHRRLLQRYVFWAAVQATLFSSPVVAFAVVGTWGYSPIGAALNGFLIGGIWVGCACAVGHARGLAAVRALEERDHHEAKVVDARRALVADIERKFGPLDESRRAAIKTRDADGLADARRRLETATRIEDLDP